MPHRIELKGVQPLVSGAYRDVYQHPLDDDLLVKVVKPIVIKAYEQHASWYRRWRGNGHYKGLAREIDQYLTLRRRGQHELPFIQRFVGVADTDLGFGMVVRKVRGADGNLAPTLATLVRDRGFAPELRARVDALITDVTGNHVVFGDISGNNIVHAADDLHGDRLVIVDGLSDRLWIPINSLSRAFNRAYCVRRFARAIRLLEAIDRDRSAAGGAPSAVRSG